MTNRVLSKWDSRYIDMAKLVSTWSKDPSTKVGAVLVRSDGTILSVGYNGFPKQMTDKLQDYNNRDIKYSRMIHGEINALIHAGCSIQGSTLYTYPFASCDRCVVQMIQAGVNHFIFPTLPKDLESRWQAAVVKAKEYIIESGTFYTEIDYAF